MGSFKLAWAPAMVLLVGILSSSDAQEMGCPSIGSPQSVSKTCLWAGSTCENCTNTCVANLAPLTQITPSSFGPFADLTCLSAKVLLQVMQSSLLIDSSATVAPAARRLLQTAENLMRGASESGKLRLTSADVGTLMRLHQQVTAHRQGRQSVAAAGLHFNPADPRVRAAMSAAPEAPRRLQVLATDEPVVVDIESCITQTDLDRYESVLASTRARQTDLSAMDQALQAASDDANVAMFKEALAGCKNTRLTADDKAALESLFYAIVGGPVGANLTEAEAAQVAADQALMLERFGLENPGTHCVSKEFNATETKSLAEDFTKYSSVCAPGAAAAEWATPNCASDTMNVDVGECSLTTYHVMSGYPRDQLKEMLNSLKARAQYCKPFGSEESCLGALGGIAQTPAPVGPPAPVPVAPSPASSPVIPLPAMTSPAMPSPDTEGITSPQDAPSPEPTPVLVHPVVHPPMYGGAGTSDLPAPSSPPIYATGMCSPPFGQCGGQKWRGATCCTEGSKCVKMTQWYSSCRSEATLPPTYAGGPSGAPVYGAIPVPNMVVDGCSTRWSQCGGVEWRGPTCCAGDNACNVQNMWYSQCQPVLLAPGIAQGTAQCGGENWQHATVCEKLYECVAHNEFYSQCVFTASASVYTP